MMPVDVKSSLQHALALTFALVLAALLPHAAAASGLDVAHFTLDNGLQVVVIPDHRTPVVTHMVWYKVGAADETPGKSGIAHFLEHLMFKGTGRIARPASSRKGPTHGGQENAYTTDDYTAYYQRSRASASRAW